MFTIEIGVVELYRDVVTEAVGAFLPLLAVTIGVFIAFAIANMLRFYILRMVK